MEFVNIKGCHGMESLVWVEGSLVRLNDLPEVLKGLSDEELARVVLMLKKKADTALRQ